MIKRQRNKIYVIKWQENEIWEIKVNVKEGKKMSKVRNYEKEKKRYIRAFILLFNLNKNFRYYFYFDWHFLYFVHSVINISFRHYVCLSFCQCKGPLILPHMGISFLISHASIFLSGWISVKSRITHLMKGGLRPLYLHSAWKSLNLSLLYLLF